MCTTWADRKRCEESAFILCLSQDERLEPLWIYVVLFTASFGRSWAGYFFKPVAGRQLAIFPPAEDFYSSWIKTVSWTASLRRIWKHSCSRGGVITPLLGRQPVLCCINLEVAELSSFGHLPQPFSDLVKKIKNCKHCITKSAYWKHCWTCVWVLSFLQWNLILSYNILLDLAAVSFVLLLTTGVCLFFLHVLGQSSGYSCLRRRPCKLLL